MTFDYLLANPPYHYETGRRKIPVYQHFIQALTEDDSIAKIVCLITPDGFVKGGQQLEPVRSQMIQTKHLKSVEFHKDKLFSGVSVDAAITLYDNRVETEEIKKGLVGTDGSRAEDILDWRYRDVEIDALKYSVLDLFKSKIACKDNMSLIIPGRAPFGLNTKCFKSNRDKFKPEESTSVQEVRILVGEEQDFYYINPYDDFSYEGSDGRIEKVKLNNADKWKMVFPKAGTVRDKCLRTRILKPGEIFTDKYLCIFADTEREALNVEKYFNSKFYRAGLDSKMTSWNMYRQWHSNIPVQDFTENSDIDWSKTAEDIDSQLYKKYGLTDSEIELINTYIRS